MRCRNCRGNGVPAKRQVVYVAIAVPAFVVLVIVALGSDLEKLSEAKTFARRAQELKKKKIFS